MKKILIVLLFLLLCPIFVLANCSNSGATVVFINGIFGKLADARSDQENLAQYFKLKYPNEKVEFITGFNESHLGGANDLATAIIQAYGYEDLDYDLTTILNQIHSQISTKKVLFVGHSQGSFYANAAYKYLIEYGARPESIGVYNVATPASYTAANGEYITSSTDKVINETVRKLAEKSYAKVPLPANANIELSAQEKADKNGGHGFSSVYLASESERITKEIDNALTKLKSSGSESGECFKQPGESLAYKIKRVAKNITDSSIDEIKNTEPAVWTSGDLAGGFNNFIAWLFNKTEDDSNKIKVVCWEPENNDSSNKESFFIGQVLSAATEIIQEYTGRGGPDPSQMTADDLQDILDDIAEKMDVIAQQIKDLQAQSDDMDKPDNKEPPPEPENNDNNDNSNVAGLGGGAARSYPTILISEIQAAGLSDAKEEFVELYNPNDADIDLTSWYLQRKTSTGKSYSSYVSAPNFSQKIIKARGYFLIARENYYFGQNVDIFTSSSISQDNSFVLKNPNGEISDKAGFGAAQDYEAAPAQNPPAGLSIGRIVLGIQTNDEKDTQNNSEDFELQYPTPKNRNLTYTKPSDDNAPAGQKDNLAPRVKFDIDEIQLSLNFAVNFEIEDLAKTTTPSGIESYIFRWQENGQESWHQDAPVSAAGLAVLAGAKNFSGEDGKTYYFQIQTKDVAGNQSDWQPEESATTKVEIPKKILINEIQIAGKDDKKEEFVELYNPGEVDVDLTGWYLQRSTATNAEYQSYASSTLFEGKTIKAKDYFVAARHGYFANEADIFTENPLTESNSLILKRRDRSVSDEVGWGEALNFETSPAQQPEDGKSIERVKIGQDTDNNSADFVVRESPSPSDSFLKLSIEDISDYGHNFLRDYYSLKLRWSSLGQGPKLYDVQYKFNNSDWQNWLTQTSATSGEFNYAFSSIIEEQNIYSFRVRVQDGLQNQSDWKQLAVDLSVPVVINEAGLFASDKNNQWIELYNKTGNAMDLTGWKLISPNSEVILSGAIAASGYFILEKDSDDTLPDIAANQIFTESLRGGYLHLLAPNSRYVDELYATNTWNFGSISEGNYYFTERISPAAFGFAKENWEENSANLAGGFLSTPNAKNSNYLLYTYLPLRFWRDLVLPLKFSPYYFNADLIVHENANLQFEPGVVIKSSDAKISVDGKITAIGTEQNPITFTSFKDLPQAGDWLGIELTSKSSGSVFDRTIFSYGGANLQKLGAALKVNKNSVVITNSVFENNLNAGLYLLNTSSDIRNNQFLGNRDAQPYTDFKATGILVTGGSDRIESNDFKENNVGIVVADYNDNDTITPGNVLIKSNTFEENRKPIYLYTLSHNSFSDNTFLNNNNLAENDGNAIFFSGLALRYKNDAVLEPGFYSSDGILVVPEGVKLTLSPGVIIGFPDAGVEIHGTLEAVGTAQNPIVFKNKYFEEEPLPGRWFGLSFFGQSQNSKLENVEVFNAGGTDSGATRFFAAVRVDNCDVSIKDSFIHDNKNNGIWLINSNSVVDNVRFYNHRIGEFSMPAKAINIQGGSPEIKNSYIENQTIGIYLDSLTANLHTSDPDDPEKNTFVLIETLDKDILDIASP